MPKNITRKDTLTPKQRAAIAALMATTSKTAAAKAAGVRRETISRWMRDPVFVAELHKAETKAVQDVARRLAVLARKAVDVLELALAGEATADQRHAANAVLANMLTIRELSSVEERLSELESRIEKVNYEKKYQKST